MSETNPSDSPQELPPRVHPRFCVGLEVRPAGSDRGLGLFLTEPLARGKPALVFGGPLLSRDEYLRFEDVERCVQIGPDTFLGPSGDLDDYTNHSCAPSTKFEVDRSTGKAALVALRDLQPGDEVTFDYATSQLDDPLLRLEGCRCRAASCRSIIRDFSHLSRSEQRRLYESGLLPWYLAEAFEAETRDKKLD